MPQSDRSPRPSMSDVAAKAGVATSTVSRALSGAAGVSEPLRHRIQTIADEMSYFVSREASALSRGATTTGRVAVIVPWVGVWFYSTVLGGIATALHTVNLDLVLYQIADTRDRYNFFDSLPIRGKVDGVLLVALPVNEPELERLTQLDVPVVMVGAELDGLPSVTTDDEDGAEQAVTYLIRLGHTKIAYINSSDADGVQWDSARAREAGYLAAMASAGLPVDERYLESTSRRQEGGAEATKRLLSQTSRPTAIFCFSDEEALGALEVAREEGLRVPEDLSIVGFDGQPIAQAAGLSTVRQPANEFGLLGGRMMATLLGRDDVPIEQRRLPSTLVIRDSSGVVPQPVERLA